MVYIEIAKKKIYKFLKRIGKKKNSYSYSCTDTSNNKNFLEL